jgi:hypothetical protein
MDPNPLLQKVAAVYEGLRTYRDQGSVTQAFVRDSVADETEATFSTHFERPDRFRLEFTVVPRPNPWPRRSFLIQSDGSNARVTYRGRSEGTNLRAAFVEVAFREQPASVIVPLLLMPGLVPDPGLMAKTKDLVHDGDEYVDGRRCHRIVGHRKEGAPSVLTVWVDAENHLVRKLYDRTMFGLTPQQRQAAENNKRLQAIGIPLKLLPPFEKTRKNYPFEVQTTMALKSEKNPTIDGKLFRFNVRSRNS